MLRDESHLLLFGEHLYLHLLLFGKGHEVIERIFLVALAPPHILRPLLLNVIEFWPVPGVCST